MLCSLVLLACALWLWREYRHMIREDREWQEHVNHPTVTGRRWDGPTPVEDRDDYPLGWLK